MFSWFYKVEMVEKLGKIALSFLISNWIYSETMLLFPQLKPYAQRVIDVAKIPTHNEWPGIVRSKNAKRLNSDINNYLAKSALAPVFVKAGILDRKVQKLIQLRQSPGSAPAGEEKQPLLPYNAGENIFVSNSGRMDLKGGYQEFKFL